MTSRAMAGFPTPRQILTGLCAVIAALGVSLAAPPEATGLRWCSSTKDCLQWDSTSLATGYRLYRGVPSGLPNLLSSASDSCLELTPSATSTGSLLAQSPSPGGSFWFLVTATSICGEGTAGSATGGTRIVNATGSCTASCMDNIKNGSETDRDCGGPICQPCIVGKICLARSDCQTRVCLASHCQPATCIDGIRNDVETDVDCGGGTCIGCVNGKLCCAGSDCQSGHCISGICQP